MKLTYACRGVENILIHLGPIVFSENRSKHFASLCSKISPAHIICIHISYKKDNQISMVYLVTLNFCVNNSRTRRVGGSWGGCKSIVIELLPNGLKFSKSDYAGWMLVMGRWFMYIFITLHAYGLPWYRFFDF